MYPLIALNAAISGDTKYTLASFARIHRSNLINNGILPLVIEAKDQDFFNDQDSYKIVNIKDVVEHNGKVKVIN